MIRKPHTPQPPGTLIRNGMKVRMTSSILWAWEGEHIRIPTGTTGTIAPWKALPRNRDGGYNTLHKGHAVVFDGIKHPMYNGFPMARHDIDWDVLPDFMEAI